MRPFLVALAVLSLAVRWADAGCGCAEHNGWLALAVEDHHGHDHDHAPPTAPVFDHGCDGECGRAFYAAAPRVLAQGATAVSVAVVLPALPAAPAAPAAGLTPSG